MTNICQVKNGYFIQSATVNAGDFIPAGWIISEPPIGDGPYFIWYGENDWGSTNIPPEPEQPEPEQYEPIRVTKIDFRRLLLPEEAAKIRILRQQPRATEEDLITAFDPETPDFTAQIKIAVEDAFEQFDLLAEFIELNHSDTAQFLGVLGLAGVFEDPQVRISQIIANQLP
jgi:hypothetical protein